MALNPSNSSNLEQLALKGLRREMPTADPDANFVQVTSVASLVYTAHDDDDEIAYFTVRWKTRASFVYRTKNIR